MGKAMSNSQAMELFKSAAEIKQDESLSSEEADRQVKSIHDRLVKELAFLVYSNARSYSRFPNYEDLVQEGYIGLLKAVRKFDYTRFPNFFVYAEQWIRNGIKKSASKFDVVYSKDRERVVYAEPSELGLEEEMDENTPEDVFFSKERASVINNILDDFPERDKEIVKRIFGVGGYKQQTLRDIGPLYNLTHERVRQIKNNVISKLRKNQRISKLY